MKQAANEALARGEVELALDLWRGVTADARCSAADLLECGVLLDSLYRSGEARVLWERLLAHEGAGADDCLRAAKCLSARKAYAEAARFTGRALAESSGSPDIAAMHAAALERAGEMEAAWEIAARAQREHPAHARLARMLAHIELRRGELDEARERLVGQLARHGSAEDWRLRYELAGVLDRLGDYDGAMAELLTAKAALAGAAGNLRGRWREMSARQWELTQLLTRERLARWRGEAGGGGERVVFLAGFPRSGTTLLEQLLTTHAACVGTDESGILATQFRDPIVFGAASAKEAVEELDGFEGEDLAAGRAEYFRCTEDVLGEVVGGRILVEKDPLLTADLALPLRMFPAGRIVMPLRDPRDVVLSFFFTLVPLAPNSVAAATLRESCEYFAEVMRHWLLLRERLDEGKWLETKYEDLLAEPEQVTRRLAGFLGIEWRREMLEHHLKRGRRAVGTPTYDDVSKPLYGRALGRWRNYERWISPNLDVLEPVMDAFGYA